MTTVREALDANNIATLEGATRVLEAAAEEGELHEALGMMLMALEDPDDTERLIEAAERLGWEPDEDRPIL